MKTYLRYMTICFGCLLAVVVICSQVYASKSVAKAGVEKSSESKEQQSDTANISMATFSLPSPVHVQINLDPHCLFEIVFESENDDTPHVALPSIEEKFFVTLFRVIISPNAP